MAGDEGNKGGSSAIDFSSPYYLHSSDSPKQPSINENISRSFDCDKDEPTKVHFESTNFNGGEQNNCFDAPSQECPSTTSEDTRTEAENITQHEDDSFENDSPVLDQEIEEDHDIPHDEPEPRSKRDTGMLGCRPSAFPFEQGTKLDKGEEEARVDATQYRRLVGRLLYLQATRPDVTYAVNVLSQFVSDPRQNHLQAANRVLRYLKGTPGQGILLPREGPSNLTAYCDSDWLGCPFTRRSRTGYLLLFGGGPISWKTKKQSVVSRSSAEAEYRAMASTVSEVLWVR
ncbi:hypothetical protein L6452_34715 [Arctium lappa]|uniref:Uncharacterized protein n=1 Tax=Arctium lappa TaxID=4217 RepID=A0ACB8YJP9_ARCLA|nr:hypothetical protein L6452_34715 [Arctium lappa]